MGVHTLLFYIISSFVLGFLLQELERRKKNCFVDSIIISNVFLLFLSGIFSTFHIVENNDNIFLIVFFQILGSIFYTNCIQEISIWETRKEVLKKYIFTLLSAYLINVFFINQTKNVFPSMEGVKIILWLLIVFYFYLFLKDSISVHTFKSSVVKYYNNKEYVVMQYAKFKTRYGRNVRTRYAELIPLIYAMMIYENYHRSELLRKMDHFKYQFFHSKGKYGIMQVYSRYELTDEKSIQIVVKKLEHLYVKTNRKNISNIIYQYYQRNNKEVIFIYKNIMQFDKGNKSFFQKNKISQRGGYKVSKFMKEKEHFVKRRRV